MDAFAEVKNLFPRQYRSSDSVLEFERKIMGAINASDPMQCPALLQAPTDVRAWCRRWTLYARPCATDANQARGPRTTGSFGTSSKCGNICRSRLLARCE